MHVAFHAIAGVAHISDVAEWKAHDSLYLSFNKILQREFMQFVGDIVKAYVLYIC